MFLTKALNEFEDEEPVGPDYIFGDTAESSSDLKPVVEKRPTIRRAFRRFRSDKEHKVIMKRAFEAAGKTFPNPLPFASTPTTRPETDRKPQYTYTDIPENGRYRHPIYGFNPDVVHENSTPEREAESRLPIENIFQYDASDLDTVLASKEDLGKTVKQQMLVEGAAMLLSFEESSAQVQAILRDGMGVDVEMDTSVSEAITQLLKLSLISTYVDNTSLDAGMKLRFMRSLTDKIAEDTHEAMNKQKTADKYKTILKHLQARVSPSSDASSPEVASQLGVLRKRSGRSGAGVSPQRSDSVDDYHSFNEEQDAGVRFENF